MMEQISLIVAFGAGLLSFFSPCVLPLVPVYLASLCGPEIFDTKFARRRLPIFLHSLSFVLGFSILFTLMGVGAGLAGFVISAHFTLIRTIAGGILIVFGLFMLAAVKVPWLNYEKRLSPAHGVTTGYLRSFLIGCLFSLAWTPCVGPILGGILTLALDSATAGQGAYLLAIYSLGLGLPFLTIGIAFDYIVPLIRRIHHYSKWVYIVSGLLLMGAGINFLTGSVLLTFIIPGALLVMVALISIKRPKWL